MFVMDRDGPSLPERDGYAPRARGNDD